MIKVTKSDGIHIMMNMLEQVGAVELLEEMVQQMSIDELNNILSGLDDFLFEKHYSGILNENPDAFDGSFRPL